MSWFTPKVSQEDFEYLVKKVQKQNAEIIRLEGKIQYLDTALSLLRVRVTELENLNKPLVSQPLAGTSIRRQEDRTPQGYTRHSSVIHTYTDSSPDLSTVMLVSVLVSDSSSSSSGSCDSSSSCGGE